MVIAAPSKTLAPADVLAMPDDGRIYELVDGELRELEMSLKASDIAGRIIQALNNFNDAHELGIVAGIDAGFECFEDKPGMMRKPDAAFIRGDRLTDEDYDDGGYTLIAPDFVAEVNSPNDKVYDVNLKCELWLNAGVKLVWVVDPATKSIMAHNADGTTEHFKHHQRIHANPVIPGFECAVADLFKRPNLKRRSA